MGAQILGVCPLHSVQFSRVPTVWPRPGTGTAMGSNATYVAGPRDSAKGTGILWPQLVTSSASMSPHVATVWLRCEAHTRAVGGNFSPSGVSSCPKGPP